LADLTSKFKIELPVYKSHTFAVSSQDQL